MTYSTPQIESSTPQDNPDTRVPVFGGVDTHLEFHVAAAVNALGALLGVAVFPTTIAGYRDLLGWLRAWGPVTAVGVEGTGSYGAALARYLDRHGTPVQEINRPDRADRRRRGKTDAYDAEAAARTTLAGTGSTAKISHGPIESLRMLKNTHDSAVKQRTAALNQMHQLLVTAPEPLRAQLTGLTKHTLPAHCAKFRPDPARLADPTVAAKRALRDLARRVLNLTKEATRLEGEITTLTRTIAPATSAAHGAGPHTVARLLITLGENPERFTNEAGFAALCGTNPIPASSGKTDRHRLNRGGDRQANSALHMVVLSRLAHDQRTRDYITARTPDGRSTPHLRRKLKRYLARELFTLLRTDLQALNHPTQAT
jgi:transposase